MLSRRGGGGKVRAWGGDLIVFVGPGVGHLTDLVLPGEGIFESFIASLGIFDSDVQPGVGDIWLHLTGMTCPSAWAGNLTANFSKMSNPHPMPDSPPPGLTLIGA